jgi:hypothetical protein
MPVLLERIYKEFTPSGGNWSYSTATEFINFRMTPRFIRQVLVRSASNDTTFDVEVEDENGLDIRRFTTVTEVVNDVTPTPILGHITLRVKNASVDEPFKALLVFCDEG